MASSSDWRLLQEQFLDVAGRLVPIPHVLMKWPKDHQLPDGATDSLKQHGLYTRYSHDNWPRIGRLPWTNPGANVVCEWWSAGQMEENHWLKGLQDSTHQALRSLVLLIDEAAHLVRPEQLTLAKDLEVPLIRWTVGLHELVQPAPRRVVFKTDSWPHAHMAFDRSVYPPKCHGDGKLRLEFTQREFISSYLGHTRLADYVPFGLVGIVVDAAATKHPNVVYTILDNLASACAQVCGLLAVEPRETQSFPTIEAGTDVLRRPPPGSNTAAAKKDGDASTTDASPSPPEVHASEDSDNVFRKKGDYWILTFNGISQPLKHGVGLLYLSHLIESQGVSVPTIDLLALRGSRPLLFVGSSGELITPDGLRQLWKEHSDLEAELVRAAANNDAAEIDRLQRDIHTLREGVKQVTRPGGGIRQKSEFQRITHTVTQAIRRSIERIDKKHSAMGRHLNATVSLGSSCIYCPEERVIWKT